jgi:fatty-acid desaturase
MKFNVPKLLLLMGLSIFSLLVAPFVGGIGLWCLSFVMYFVYACLGIVVGFHRLLSHRSFATKVWIEKLLMIFGTLAGNGSSITWLMVHTDHHRYSDTDKDPHNPKQGMLNSIMLNYARNRVKSKYAVKIAKDSFHKFLHNWYFAIHVVWMVLISMLFGVKVMLFTHLVPIGFVSIMSHLKQLDQSHLWIS